MCIQACTCKNKRKVVYSITYRLFSSLKRCLYGSNLTGSILQSIRDTMT